MYLDAWYQLTKLLFSYVNKYSKWKPLSLPKLVALEA